MLPVCDMQAELEALLDKFEQIALEAAQRGEIQRPSERRQQQQLGQGDADNGRAGGRVSYGSGERGSYERHGRGHYDREGGGRGAYGGEPREYDRHRGGPGRGSYGPRGTP